MGFFKNLSFHHSKKYLLGFLFSTFFLIGFLSVGESPLLFNKGEFTQDTLVAKHYDSNFKWADKTYNGISTASNGKIYYAISSHSLKKGAQFYSFDPRKEKIVFLGDLTKSTQEKNEKKAIPQGKVHVNFYENNKKLYFATHLGVYNMINGLERYPENPPEGYRPYPGGYIFEFNMASNEIEKLAVAPQGEGIITMAMDTVRNQIYGLTWPTGYFIHYDVENGTLINKGHTSKMGEAGSPGYDYRVICRAMFVDPKSGSVYYSTAEGDIFQYNPTTKSISKVDVSLKREYFGYYDPTQPGSMAYNWRQIVWNPSEEVAYGVHGNSGYLFRFNPRKPSLELVERITSKPSKKRGMFDEFPYGYLGFTLGPNNKKIFYLTGGPIQDECQCQNVEKQVSENLHLVTYDLSQYKYHDHGPVFFKNGKRVMNANSITIGPDENIYTIALFSENSKLVSDLVKIFAPKSLAFSK